jgi:hypothetical protein
VVCCIIFSKLNCVFGLSSFPTQHTCTVCIIELSASLTENTVYHNNNKPGVTLLVDMATVVCVRGRNPMPDPFLVDRFRLYLARHLKIFLILRPNFEVPILLYSELWLLQAHRHIFVTIWACWLDNLWPATCQHNYAESTNKQKARKNRETNWNEII